MRGWSMSQDVFIVIPFLEGWPTKIKETTPPHEVRLIPLDINPAFQCLRENWSFTRSPHLFCNEERQYFCYFLAVQSWKLFNGKVQQSTITAGILNCHEKGFYNSKKRNEILNSLTFLPFLMSPLVYVIWKNVLW